jgi:hypothetical protein
MLIRLVVWNREGSAFRIFDGDVRIGFSDQILDGFVSALFDRIENRALSLAV